MSYIVTQGRVLLLGDLGCSELGGFVSSLSKIDIKLQDSRVGTEWRFHPPDEPHANGAIESMVKVVKRALLLAISNSVLSFSELQTVCCEAAELVNERPLSVSQLRASEDLPLDYICPNQLLGSVLVAESLLQRLIMYLV